MTFWNWSHPQHRWHHLFLAWVLEPYLDAKSPAVTRRA
jgi:hypothetical protein